MWLTRRNLLLAALATTGARADPAPVRSVEPGALALRGFDTVSYFLPEGPRAGSAAHEMAWRGRGWRFASALNRAAFARDPEVYAPRLGGHDPVGVLEGRLVDADPLVFAVLEGRLYLFRDAGRRDRLSADRAAEPGLLARAEALWPTLDRLQDAGPG